MKKKGGSTVTISKDTGKVTLPHRVTKESNIYKGIKILEDSK
jgi:ribosomal protein L32